jgi:hypothetical protein
MVDVDNYVNDPKAIDRRDKDKISGILFKKLKKARWPDTDECDCSEKYSITIDSAGRVSKVTLIDYATYISDNDEFDICIATVLSALKKLKFDIVKDKGKPIAEDVYLEIWVTEKGKLENWTY